MADAGVPLAEAAERLQLPVEQVRDLVAAGALTAVGDGDALRITHESLLIYLSKRLTSDLDRVMKPPPRGAVAASAFLPLLLGMTFLAACVEIFSLRGRKPIVPGPAAALGVAALLALAYGMARKAPDLASTNGLGTALYGKRMTPHGRVGTQWVIVSGVPLLPVRSYVILESGDQKVNWSGVLRTQQYYLRPLPGIFWPQAGPVLAGVWAALAALVALAIRG